MLMEKEHSHYPDKNGDERQNNIGIKQTVDSKRPIRKEKLDDNKNTDKTKRKNHLLLWQYCMGKEQRQKKRDHQDAEKVKPINSKHRNEHFYQHRFSSNEKTRKQDKQ